MKDKKKYTRFPSQFVTRFCTVMKWLFRWFCLPLHAFYMCLSSCLAFSFLHDTWEKRAKQLACEKNTRTVYLAERSSKISMIVHNINVTFILFKCCDSSATYATNTKLYFHMRRIECNFNGWLAGWLSLLSLLILANCLLTHIHQIACYEGAKKQFAGVSRHMTLALIATLSSVSAFLSYINEPDNRI